MRCSHVCDGREGVLDSDSISPNFAGRSNRARRGRNAGERSVKVDHRADRGT